MKINNRIVILVQIFIASFFLSSCTILQEHLNVVIDPKHQQCENDNDCALVFTACNNCECGTPVSKDWKEVYEKKRIRICAKYKGLTCDTECPNVTLVCKLNKCTMNN